MNVMPPCHQQQRRWRPGVAARPTARQSNARHLRAPRRTTSDAPGRGSSRAEALKTIREAPSANIARYRRIYPSRTRRKSQRD